MDADFQKKISDWQNKIEKAFTDPTGKFAPRLTHINDAEQRHEYTMTHNLYGFDRLNSAFQDFTFQTITEAYEHKGEINKFNLLVIVATLRRYRAAIRTFSIGYYFDSAALLRAVFENAIYLGALLHGFVKEWAMWDTTGLDHEKEVSRKDLHKTLKKNLKKHDALLLSKMRGEESGLSKEEQDQIEVLVRTLHSHVHRAESTLLYSLKTWQDALQGPFLLPEYVLAHANIVSTAFHTTGWLMLRVLPHVMLNPRVLTENWHFKYAALDDAFSTCMALNGKPIHLAVQSMVYKRFTFDGMNPK